jgi:phosphoribosylformylglycinamidine synthase
MDAKAAGNYLLLVGQTHRHMGGSWYYALHQQNGRSIPAVDLATAPGVHQRVAKLISEGLVASAHDPSEGGLAVALAEMLFAGQLGAEIDLTGVPHDPEVDRDDILLFSESPTRYVLEVKPEHLDDVLRRLRTLAFGILGRVTQKPELVVQSINGKTIIKAPVEQFRQAWRKTLDW